MKYLLSNIFANTITCTLLFFFPLTAHFAEIKSNSVGFCLFTSNSPTSLCLPFPSCNDDGMGYNHLIMACFWGWLHPTDKGKGRIESHSHELRFPWQQRGSSAVSGSEKWGAAAHSSGWLSAPLKPSVKIIELWRSCLHLFMSSY